MLKFLRANPEADCTGKIMKVVLEGVLLNKYVIAICDDLHENFGGPNGDYYCIGFDSNSDIDDDDLESLNSFATEYTAVSASSATSNAFKKTTFWKILTGEKAPLRRSVVRSPANKTFQSFLVHRSLASVTFSWMSLSHRSVIQDNREVHQEHPGVQGPRGVHAPRGRHKDALDVRLGRQQQVLHQGRDD